MSRVPPLLAIGPLALAFAACSDPPPTPAAAGISMTLAPAMPIPNVDLGSRSCNAGKQGNNTYTYSLGDPNPGKTIEDGTKNVKVDCIVRADGSFSASASGSDAGQGTPVSFTFSGTVHDKNTPASNPGKMTFYSPDTLQLVTLDQFPGCTVGKVITLKKGAILTDIQCPIIAAGDDPASGCRAYGTIAFEYCKTGEEEN